MNAILTRTAAVVLTATLMCLSTDAAAQILPGSSSAQEPREPDANVAEQPESSRDAGSSLLESPFFKVGWPKVEMPRFDWKPGFGGGKPTREASGAAENPVSTTLDKVADGSRRAADRVRDAWGSAIKQLSFTSDATPQQQSDEPGFWTRLFRSEEPKQPRTTTEFIAQDRVGTRR